jgi:hypothetical protein
MVCVYHGDTHWTPLYLLPPTQPLGLHTAAWGSSWGGRQHSLWSLGMELTPRQQREGLTVLLPLGEGMKSLHHHGPLHSSTLA